MPIPVHPAPHRRLSPWALLVAGSAVVVLGCALVLGVWWLQSSRKQVATYAVRGAVNRITLDLGGADAIVVGGGSGRSVQVTRTDEFSFGRRPARRSRRVGRRAATALALPGERARVVLGELPRDGARTTSR